LHTSNERSHRRRTRKSPWRLAALVTVAAALAAPATAGAKLLVETYNEGLQPSVFLDGTSSAISNPKRITVEFSSSHEAELVGWFAIKCDRGRARSYSLSDVSPARRTVRIGGQPGKCRVVGASARFADPLDEGWIKLRASGSG
jgi:hypothetical protein